MVLGFRAHSTHARTTTTFDGIYLHACVRAIGRYCGAAAHDFGLRDVLMVDLFGRVVVVFLSFLGWAVVQFESIEEFGVHAAALCCARVSRQLDEIVGGGSVQRFLGLEGEKSIL